MKKETFSKTEKKGQVFSLDTIIGVVIFLVVFTVFFAMVSKNTEKDSSTLLSEEAQMLTNRLVVKDDERDGISLVNQEGQLTAERLDELSAKDYELLKKQLDMDGDFCVFFENMDGSINEQLIQEMEKVGIGSDRINVTGISCSMD